MLFNDFLSNVLLKYVLVLDLRDFAGGIAMVLAIVIISFILAIVLTASLGKNASLQAFIFFFIILFIVIFYLQNQYAILSPISDSVHQNNEFRIILFVFVIHYWLVLLCIVVLLILMVLNVIKRNS